MKHFHEILDDRISKQHRDTHGRGYTWRPSSYSSIAKFRFAKQLLAEAASQEEAEAS